MLILCCRVLFSIAGLLLCILFAQLSANECLKLCVLLAAFLLGVVTVLLRIVVPVFYLDAASKGYLRGQFGMRPNPNAVLQAMFVTDQAETGAFLLRNNIAWLAAMTSRRDRAGLAEDRDALLRGA